MSQVFHQSADTWLRVFFAALALSVVGCGFWMSRWWEPFYVTQEGHAIAQPVPFSHRHHVDDVAIQCRHCHTSVETSDFAGIPPTHTCMSCHSQILSDSELLEPVRRSYTEGEPIRWNRVYDLPDFVQFSHQVHVNNGVGCESCHGRVDRMPLIRQDVPLTMQWCLDCHREPWRELRPPDAIYAFGWKYEGDDRDAFGRDLMEHYDIDTQILTDCSICHY